MPAAGPHHSFSYHEALIHDLSPDPTLVSIVCLRDEQGMARAILPLEPARRRLSRLNVAVWQVPEDPDRSTSDVIAGPDVDWAAAAPTLVACLRRARPRVGLLALDRVRRGSPAWLLARAIAGTRVVAEGELHRFRTEQPFDQLLAATSASFRKNLRRGWRRLSHEAPVRHEIARQRHEVEDAFERFVELEAAGWKGRERRGTPLLSRPAVRERFRRALLRLADAGQCEIHLLVQTDACIAARILILGRNEIYAAKSTYAEALSASSPGHLLLERVLFECCERPSIASLNLGSEAHWSAAWCPETEPIATAYVPLTGGMLGRTAIGLLAIRGIAAAPD